MKNTTATIGRPAAKVTWPKGKFTLKAVLNARNTRNTSILNTIPGLKARAEKDVAAGVLFKAGTKERKAGEVGRPQFLYTLNPEDVPKELRDPKINGAIRRVKNQAAKNQPAATA